MPKKKKALMYEMQCDKCGKDPILDAVKSNGNWNVIPMNCECGGRIKIYFSKPYYVDDVKGEFRRE